MSKNVFLLIISIACLLAVHPTHGIVIDTSESFDEPISTGVGGRSLVVEELTATWCPSCAEIDPFLVQVADGHGSRIVMLALHPTDGEDAFQPEASQHRIDRRVITHPALASTPTFIVEGGDLRVGYDAWGDVQSDILEKELQRASTSQLAFKVVRDGEQLIASVSDVSLSRQDGQLTFLLLEHEKEVPDSAMNPGDATRDRVVVGTAECDLSTSDINVSIGLNASSEGPCTSSFSIAFEPTKSWSIVLLHEPTIEELQSGAEGSSYGSIEMSFRDRAADSTNQSPIIITLFLLIGASLILPGFFRNSFQSGKNIEENVKS